MATVTHQYVAEAVTKYYNFEKKNNLQMTNSK